MATKKSKLDEIFERNTIIRYADNGDYEGEWFDADTAKAEIKALALEIHKAAHDEAASEADAMRIFEKKVEEL